MSFGNILGQIMRDGMTSQSRTRDRFTTGARNLDQAGGGLGGIFERLQGAQGGRSVSGSGGQGGLTDMARDFLGGKQAGGFTGGQIGGIGAAVGAMLGGGIGGAAKGGALAVLGTLAIGALRGAGGQGTMQETGMDESGAGARPVQRTDDVSDAELASLTGDEAERLMLSTMISAANADGRIDAGEMRAILGKLDESDATDAERDAVMDEIRDPLTPQALAGRVQGEAQGAQAYAAAILAVDGTSAQAQAYLHDLAEALRLDAGTVERLHGMTGTPAHA